MTDRVPWHRAAALTASILGAHLSWQAARAVVCLTSHLCTWLTPREQLHQFFHHDLAGWVLGVLMLTGAVFVGAATVVHVTEAPAPPPTRSGLNGLRMYVASLIFVPLLEILVLWVVRSAEAGRLPL